MNALKSIHRHFKTSRRVLPNPASMSCATLFSGKRLFNWQLPLLILSLTVAVSCNLFAASDSTKHWVGTWACAPYPMGSNNSDFPPAIANNTARQIVRVSIGGDTLRVKFSNKTCKSSVIMNAVNIAVSPDGTKSPVTASTITPLKFGGNTSVTMNAGTLVTSDPVAFALTPSTRVAITIYYGTAGNGSDMTGHVASRTNSYVASGDQSTKATFTGTVQNTMHWFHIIGIDVLADSLTHAVACLGNSITDGYCLTNSPALPGLQNRWTDIFSEKLLANPSTTKVGVLNLGIGATNITGSGETTGMSRYKRDIFEQSDVRWFIVFYGVNDINANVPANSITNAYKTMVSEGHAKNMKVYGATIAPFKGHDYYDAAGNHEKVRQDVNKWIRTSGNFDAFIDFDKAMQDPNSPDQYLSTYKCDGLHPNVAGYKAMGESVDLKLFAIDSTAIRSIEGKKKRSESIEMFYPNSVNGNTMINFEISHDAFVSFKIFSIFGQQIAEFAGRNFSPGKHAIELKNRNLTNGTYIYSLKAGKFSVSRRMTFLAN